jgi:hypothetical protein
MTPVAIIVGKFQHIVAWMHQFAGTPASDRSALAMMVRIAD